MPPPSLPPPQLNKVPEGGAMGGAAASNTLNLGMAQIIVTAATPMVEDGADKSFPPVGENEQAQSGAPAAPEVVAAEKQQPKQEPKQPQLPEKPKPEQVDKKPDIVPKPSAKVLQQKQRSTQPVTITVKEGNEVAKMVKTAGNTVTESLVSRHAEDAQSSLDSASDDVPVLQETEDPFNEKSAGAATTESGGGFEANFEANFDANFDDAFASAGAGGGGGGGGGGEQSHNLDMNCEAPAEDVIEAPKQVVGGRASIPEELDSNQLARLENLKESNA